MTINFQRQTLAFEVKSGSATAQVNIFLGKETTNPEEEQVASILLQEDDQTKNIESVLYDKNVVLPIVRESIAYANISDFNLTEDDFTVKKVHTSSSINNQCSQKPISGYKPINNL